MAACDTVFLFDLPVEVCLEGAISRLGKARYDMPWIDTELDPKLKRDIEEFPSKNLPAIYALLDKYNDKNIWHIFMSWDDNPYISEEAKASMRASMSAEELKSRQFGEFQDFGGRVYTEFDEQFEFVAWLVLILLVVDILILPGKSRFTRNIKLFVKEK